MSGAPKEKRPGLVEFGPEIGVHNKRMRLRAILGCLRPCSPYMLSRARAMIRLCGVWR